MCDWRRRVGTASVILLRSVAAAVSLALATSPGFAQEPRTERGITLGLQIGVDPVPSGHVAKPYSEWHPGGTTIRHHQRFRDVYRPPWTIGLEVSRPIARTLGIFGRAVYTRASGRGPVEIERSIVRPDPTVRINEGTFTAYSSLAFEGGVRQYYGPEDGRRPYLGVMAGFTEIAPIRLERRLGTISATSNWFERSVVPVAGAVGGVSFALGSRVRVRVESGMRVQGRPHLSPGRQVDNAGSRWSIPIVGVVEFPL